MNKAERVLEAVLSITSIQMENPDFVVSFDKVRGKRSYSILYKPEDMYSACIIGSLTSVKNIIDMTKQYPRDSHMNPLSSKQYFRKKSE